MRQWPTCAEAAGGSAGGGWACLPRRTQPTMFHELNRPKGCPLVEAASEACSAAHCAIAVPPLSPMPRPLHPQAHQPRWTAPARRGRGFTKAELKACARCERAGRICVLCTSNGQRTACKWPRMPVRPAGTKWRRGGHFRLDSRPRLPTAVFIHIGHACIFPTAMGVCRAPTWSPPLADRRLSTRSPAPPAACPAQVRTLTELQVARHSTWLRTAPTNLLNYPTRGRTGPAANCPFPE